MNENSLDLIYGIHSIMDAMDGVADIKSDYSK